MFPAFLDLVSIRATYANGLSPLDLVEEVLARIAAGDDPAIFVTKTPAGDLHSAARDLLSRAPVPNSLPLLGRALRSQGQYRRRRPPDHPRLPGLRL